MKKLEFVYQASYKRLKMCSTKISGILFRELIFCIWLFENTQRFVDGCAHRYLSMYKHVNMSRVDMEIGKFEYCNPLHKPVMLLLHYHGRTYLSFIMYRSLFSENDGLWIDVELQRVKEHVLKNIFKKYY